MLAELGSGTSSMSEASMPFQPAIEEPSKACPDVNLSSSKWDTGTVVCCCLPRVSVKRKSTNLTSFSFTNFITSATVFAIRISCSRLVKNSMTSKGMQFLCQSLVHGTRRRLRYFALLERHCRQFAGSEMHSGGDFLPQPAMHQFDANIHASNWCTTSAHQFGAQLEIEAMQAGQQGRVGGQHQGRVALHPQLDVPAVLRVVHAGQAEHLDAGMLALDGLHQGRERGLHRAEHDDRLLHMRDAVEEMGVMRVQHPLDHRPGHHRKARYKIHRATALPHAGKARDLVVGVGNDLRR